MKTYLSETKEFLPVTITRSGVVVTTGVKLSIVPEGERPDTWTDPSTLDGGIGYMIEDLAVGTYVVYAQITANPELPAIECGLFRVR